MSLDVAAGIVAITALSVLAFKGGRCLRTHSHQVGQRLFFTASLLSALVFAWSLSGDLAWAAILPVASVIFLSNLMPILLSMAAGLASHTPGLARWPRVATMIALLGLAIAYTITPVARPLLAPVETEAISQWRGDACLQTHSSTCAPAAAATLLRLAGVASDERTLVDACLTSHAGTEPLGLYRGLAMVSDHSWCHPQVASDDPGDWLGHGQLPNIALVRFSDAPRRGSLQRFLGPWGEGHAIVVCSRDASGNWTIEDPAFGRTTWTDRQLRRRFTGDAIFLARRSD